LQVEVVTVPTYGTLRETIGKRVLSAGDVLDMNFTYPSAFEMKVEYTGSSNYFNSPSTNWDGTSISGTNAFGDDKFSVRALALDGSDLISLTSTVSIEVINVNDASILTGPEQGLSVYAYSSLLGDDDTYPSTLTLSGIDLTSVDGDVDFVKVRITCDFGKVYINSANLSRLDFTSSQYCYASSQSLTCKNAYGDGYRDMIYLGTPSDVATSLDDMTYTCSTEDVVDKCVIKVYDGAGGNCMPKSLLNARRDGTHTDDDSGDVSSYLTHAALVSGSSSSVQCYDIEQWFNVSVLKFAAAAARSSNECTGACINWKIVVVIVIAVFACCIGTPVYLQRKYTNYVNRLIGLALYDSDDEEDPGSVSARL
jgi:hypothetical protein